MIGPFRGGRAVAVAGVPGDPATFYFGSVGGGVWKTTDAGMVWTPLFDRQPAPSIGAIAVAPSMPNVVYAGTGEADIRSQIGFGDGIYKSTDAGQTWTNVGLRDTRQISKIVIDPRDPNTVFVAALGHVYGPNPERGVFRSTDGGKHWTKVLYEGPDLGAADLVLAPGTSTLYATLWNAKRPPWSQYAPVEGPGSGLYRSTDGGEHWTHLTGRGLPDGQWGRAGVAAAPGGKRVYTLIDAKDSSGLYRSEDGGESWTRSCADKRLTERSWYFSNVTVDPNHPDTLFIPNVAVFRSTDSGQTFSVFKGAPGGDDYHILWIDPAESRRMLLGSDQGTNVTLNGGQTWSTWFNQPTAQMYHVTTDNQFPYVVYGSQQDSGTAAVPSRTNHGEIDARDWFAVGGAEAGYIAVDPKDPDIFFVGDTYGTLSRFDRRTGQSHTITPWLLREGGFAGSLNVQKYRFSWTSPLVFSPQDPNILYFGAQKLLKTTDGGLRWQEISRDLTGDTRPDRTPIAAPVTAENAMAAGFGVIYAIAPSPLQSGQIWVGTDTGLIHLTRDGGQHWDNVTPHGLPRWSRVTQIEASHFDPTEAYATVDRHRLHDYRPYLYRTRDYGKTWTLAVDGLAEPAYLNGVREDPARRGLLYAATERNVAVSFDDGGHWQSLQLNMPACSVRDLVVHGDDLVIATFGRGFWILDNASPLRQIGAPSAADTFLYKPAQAIRISSDEFPGTPFPPEEPKANNPPAGIAIDYYLRAPAAEVSLEILDAAGKTVRKYSSTDAPPAPRKPGAIADSWFASPAKLGVTAGMTRFYWDLRYALNGFEGYNDNGNPFVGPLMLPGAYQVRLTADGRSYTQPLQVAMDPRSKATAADLSKQLELSLAIAGTLGQAAEARKHTADNALLSKLASITADLTTLLAVAESADRTPPDAASQAFEQSRGALAALFPAAAR